MQSALCFIMQFADHAHTFDSMRHADSISMSSSPSTEFSSGFKCMVARKYTIAVFSQSQMEILSKVLSSIYNLSPGVMVAPPQSYRRMSDITINEQKLKSGQYVLAKNVFNFEINLHVEEAHTVFNDPLLRPAIVDHFAVYSAVIDDSTITHGFAVVRWPMCHPLRNHFGKPYQVWCNSLFESSLENFLLPLENIHSLLLATRCDLEDERVLVTIPLLL